jgi:hypothetical protein
MVIYLSTSLSRSRALDLAPSQSTSFSHSLFVSLSLSHTHTHIIVGGVDICAMLHQGSQHVEVPFLAREGKSRPALDETRKEKNAH